MKEEEHMQSETGQKKLRPSQATRRADLPATRACILTVYRYIELHDPQDQKQCKLRHLRADVRGQEPWRLSGEPARNNTSKMSICSPHRITPHIATIHNLNMIEKTQ